MDLAISAFLILAIGFMATILAFLYYRERVRNEALKTRIYRLEDLIDHDCWCQGLEFGEAEKEGHLKQ